MPESRAIRIYEADDWVWVYADERLVYEGHSISGTELLRALEYDDWKSSWFEDRKHTDAEIDEVQNAENLPHSEFPSHMFTD